MPAPASRTKLLTLIDREFRSIAIRPTPAAPKATFKARRIDVLKFASSGCDHKRSSVLRLAALMLSNDDVALTARICASVDTARTYAAGPEMLRRESAYLRRLAGMLEQASGRLSAVLERCGATEQT
jgi:hypothetical protein